MQFVPVDSWSILLGQCRRSAFHLEVRDTYAVPSESEPFRRFLAGEPEPPRTDRPWTVLVRETTARGVVISRVRVVSIPHTDYHRWLLSLTSTNVAAGEDIRYLPRHLIPDELVPADDAWIFDDERVAFNLIDADGRPAGVAITTDNEIVQRYQRTRQRLWEAAIPFVDYSESSQARQ